MMDGREAPYSQLPGDAAPLKLPTPSWRTCSSTRASPLPRWLQYVLVPPDRMVTDRQRLRLELRGQARVRGKGFVREMRGKEAGRPE